MAELAGLTVTLEAVTPLFLAGAEPRGAPELRPPAFRGALRYWFRAAAGGVLGGDIQAVARAERKVFGAAADGGGASAVVVLLVDLPSNPKSEVYKKEDFGSPLSGRNYLYWSMAESGSREKGNYQAPKQYYLSGTRFGVELAARPGATAAGSGLEQAVAALWLLVQLGGIGSRARRLGGSLSAPASVEHAGLEFALSGASAAAVAEELASGLRQVRSIMAKYYAGGRAPSQSPAFDILEPGACNVWVLGMYDRWETASDAVGGTLRTFRVAAHGASAAVPSLRERAVFGLPLRGVSLTPSQIDRRASPLWLKLSKTLAGRYAAVATLFRSEFLPAGVQLNGSAPPRDYRLIERWIEERFPARQEVQYA